MAETGPDRRMPRAVIHKRVLEVAAANPRLSIEGIAAAVSGASPALVERVLEEYGEPAPDTDPTPIEPMATDASAPTVEQLSEKQLRVLRAIRERPDATQRELAEQLGVARATISNRVNAIEGLEWDTRAEFVSAFFDEGEDGNNDGAPTGTGTETGADPPGAIEGLRRRIADLETELDGRDGAPTSPFEDPELAAKVIRACVAADAITEEEELRVIRTVLGDT